MPVDAANLDKLRQIVRPTTVIRSNGLSEHLGADVTICSETFQHTGSFKFRAAYHAASSVSETKIIAASSGNFGQAVAYACRLLGKSCIIVMPNNSVSVKIEAVRSYGGEVDLVDVKVKTRSQRVLEVEKEHPDARVLSAYDDLLVIEGNSTLGEELSVIARDSDCIVVPIGGGGLASGVINGLARKGCTTKVFGAEPLLGNDAKRSLDAGHVIKNESEPQTIADGARTLCLGKHNWNVLSKHLTDIIEVSDEMIAKTVRILFRFANLKAEPTGALAVAAIMARPELFKGRKVCCIVSGGNVDAEVYAKIIQSDR